jgi:Na+/H+-dicarboxylate symporter
MRLSFNVQIFLGALIGIVAGIVLGHMSLPTDVTHPVLIGFALMGHAFISLLKMILMPLIFTSLVSGIINLQGNTNAGRVWSTFLIYSICTSCIAAVTGLIVVNLFKPGADLNINLFKDQMANFQAQSVNAPQFLKTLLDNLFTNPFTAMTQNNVLGIVAFATLIGITLVILGQRAATVSKVIQEASEMIMMIVGWIMRLAPLGIMGLLASLVSSQDLQLLSTLSQYIGLVLGTTLFHGAVTLPLILWLITRMSPWFFFNAMKEAFLTAFSTSSSNATLPVSLRCVTDNLKVNKNIAGFVLPVGATVNMDGTALYEAMAALFVANLCGIHLDIWQQAIVVLTAMVAAIGAPGIPSAGMVTMIMVLQAVGLPAEAVAILIPIDRPLDTLRTVVNVEGDAVGACVVEKITTPKPQQA